MKVFKMVEDAKLPTKAPGDRAYDLYSIEDVDVHYGGLVKVRTGIKIGFPEGYHAILKPRSGLAANEGIDILAGVIDSTYTGEIIVVLNKVTFGFTPFKILKGMKICQMKLEKDVTLEVQEVFNEEELGESSRGSKGFGSSSNF